MNYKKIIIGILLIIICIFIFLNIKNSFNHSIINLKKENFYTKDFFTDLVRTESNLTREEILRLSPNIEEQREDLRQAIRQRNKHIFEMLAVMIDNEDENTINGLFNERTTAQLKNEYLYDHMLHSLLLSKCYDQTHNDSIFLKEIEVSDFHFARVINNDNLNDIFNNYSERELTNRLLKIYPQINFLHFLTRTRNEDPSSLESLNERNDRSINNEFYENSTFRFFIDSVNRDKKTGIHFYNDSRQEINFSEGRCMVFDLKFIANLERIKFNIENSRRFKHVNSQYINKMFRNNGKRDEQDGVLSVNSFESSPELTDEEHSIEIEKYNEYNDIMRQIKDEYLNHLYYRNIFCKTDDKFKYFCNNSDVTESINIFNLTGSINDQTNSDLDESIQQRCLNPDESNINYDESLNCVGNIGKYFTNTLYKNLYKYWFVETNPQSESEEPENTTKYFSILSLHNRSLLTKLDTIQKSQQEQILDKQLRNRYGLYLKKINDTIPWGFSFLDENEEYNNRVPVDLYGYNSMYKFYDPLAEPLERFNLNGGDPYIIKKPEIFTNFNQWRESYSDENDNNRFSAESSIFPINKNEQHISWDIFDSYIDKRRQYIINSISLKNLTNRKKYRNLDELHIKFKNIVLTEELSNAIDCYTDSYLSNQNKLTENNEGNILRFRWNEKHYKATTISMTEPDKYFEYYFFSLPSIFIEDGEPVLGDFWGLTAEKYSTDENGNSILETTNCKNLLFRLPVEDSPQPNGWWYTYDINYNSDNTFKLLDRYNEKISIHHPNELILGDTPRINQLEVNNARKQPSLNINCNPVNEFWLRIENDTEIAEVFRNKLFHFKLDSLSSDYDYIDYRLENIPESNNYYYEFTDYFSQIVRGTKKYKLTCRDRITDSTINYMEYVEIGNDYSWMKTSQDRNDIIFNKQNIKFATIISQTLDRQQSFNPFDTIVCPITLPTSISTLPQLPPTSPTSISTTTQTEILIPELPQSFYLVIKNELIRFYYDKRNSKYLGSSMTTNDLYYYLDYTDSIWQIQKYIFDYVENTNINIDEPFLLYEYHNYMYTIPDDTSYQYID